MGWRQLLCSQFNKGPLTLGALITPGPPEAIGSWEDHQMTWLFLSKWSRCYLQWGAKGVQVVRESKEL